MELPARTTSAESSPAIVLIAYPAWVGTAEMLLVFVDVVLGAVAHAALVAAVLTHRGFRPRDPMINVAPAVALVSMLRLLSLTVTAPALPEPIWLAVLGLIIAAAALQMGHALGLRYRPKPLTVRRLGLQAVLAASGIPLGAVIAALASAPAAAIWRSDTSLPVITVALVIAGLSQEVLYRGVVQRLLASVLVPGLAVVVTALMSAAMYLGTGLPGIVIFMAGLGLAYGWVTSRTGAIAGVAMGHATMLLTAGWLT